MRTTLDIPEKLIEEAMALTNLLNDNQVGIPDLIIIQQVIDERITLFSFGKHFRLMNRFLNFDLLCS